MVQKCTMVIISKLQKQIKYYTTMTETKTIALSKETAELLEAKKKLEECFDTLAKVHEKTKGYERGFDDRLASGYGTIKDLILALMTESIDNVSTESQYKVI